jgi:hypothetical protein
MLSRRAHLPDASRVGAELRDPQVSSESSAVPATRSSARLVDEFPVSENLSDILILPVAQLTARLGLTDSICDPRCGSAALSPKYRSK